MNKKLVLSQIQKIYVVHKKWLANLQKIQTGSIVDTEAVDFSIENCPFCKWYSNPSLRKEYEEELIEMEKAFKKVHKILQTIKKKGIITINKNGKEYYESAFEQLNAKEQAILLAYFKDLKNAHKKISFSLRKLYKDIGESNDGKEISLF